MTRPDPTRRSERARTAILTAARELLSEVGFVRLTVEAIAARAGVGKQTIYRWWSSKEAVLFDALVADQTAPGGSQDLPDTGDITADLRSVLRAVVAELTEPSTDRLLRTITAEIQHDETLAAEMLDRVLRPQLTATADRIRSAQRAGQIAPSADPVLITELLYGPIFHRWLLRTAPLHEAYADQLLRQVLAGLLVRSSS
jgi:AcrR family transcriptional regulator